MFKTKIPGHPNYIINERGQVFHRETKEHVELLEGKFTFRTPEGKVKVSYDSVMKSLEEAKKEMAEPVSGMSSIDKPGVELSEKAKKAVKKPVEEHKPKKEKILKPPKDEKKIALIKEVKDCIGFDPLAEIVKKNKIDVDLSGIKLFRGQRKAVLKALKKK